MQLITFDEQLNSIVERWNLLRHPFYEAWLAGTLTRSDLCDYAIQYAHVVAAMPTWLQSTAESHPSEREMFVSHAREEFQHIALWNEFAAALGVSCTQIEGTLPNEATAALLRQCKNAADSGSGAAVVWALEVQAPEVSAEKLRGLAAHYEIEADSGAQYFALHAELDKEHERQLREFMQMQGPGYTLEAPAIAEAATKKLWNLLTSVHHV